MAEIDNRAKEPLSPLLVGPYGHPFHPILVTVPIGAWVCSVVLDVASRISADAALVDGARWLIGIGVVGALAAAAVGFLDFLTIPSGTTAHRTALVHMALNLAVTAAFAAGFVWRLGDDRSATGWGPLGLSLVSVAALAVSGSLGGRLAYRYGVRVADEATQLTGFARDGGPVGAAQVRRAGTSAPEAR
jgi:uncharacterized membrane protein